MPLSYGYYDFDDESNDSENQVLYNNEQFKQVFTGQPEIWGTDIPSNGHARCSKYWLDTHLRSSNTVVKAGEATIEEMLVGPGVYAKGLRQLTMDERGDFTLYPEAAFIVRNGAVQQGLGAFSLQGNIFDSLSDVKLLSCDSKIFSAYCPFNCNDMDSCPSSVSSPALLFLEQKA